MNSPKAAGLAFFNQSRSKLLRFYRDSDMHETLIELTPPARNFFIDLLPPSQYIGKFNFASIKDYRKLFIELNKHTKIICTYAITSTKTGRVYVGSTEDFYTRWRKHVHTLEKGKHTNIQLQAEFEDCTLSDFTIEIIRSYDSTDGLIDRECADAKSFDPDMLLNFKVGHSVVSNWCTLKNMNKGRASRSVQKKRGPNTKERWYDFTGTRC